VILSTGLVLVFRIFFDSSSGIRHLSNRLTAHTLLEKEIWKFKKLQWTEDIIDRYKDKSSYGDNPCIEVSLDIERINGFDNLFKLDSTARWHENKKEVNINRTFYIRDPVR